MTGLEAVAPMVTLPAVVTDRLDVVLPPVNVTGLELHVPFVDVKDTVVAGVKRSTITIQACFYSDSACGTGHSGAGMNDANVIGGRDGTLRRTKRACKNTPLNIIN
jgi:hypothetical protein